MPRGRKKKGFNRRSHNEHPGVTIGVDRSGGNTVVVLRWYDPVEPGKKPKRRKVVVVDHNDVPVTSRDAAKPAAIAKSKELRNEEVRIESGLQATNYDGTWSSLLKAHTRYLEAKGSSPKTIKDYRQVGTFLKGWAGCPSKPAKLTVDDLRGFVLHVKGIVSERTGAPLSPHSVAAALRNLKAVLNFGRKELACIRLDGESINRGLKQGKLPRLLPVVHPTETLNAILEAALNYDEGHPRANVFPFLAFLMVTGCRRGEAEHLRWAPSASRRLESWVDFDGSRVVIYGAKTRYQRSLPLERRPLLTQMLQVMKSATDVADEPFVFGGHLPLAIGDKRQGPDENNDKSKRLGRSLKSALKGVKLASGAEWKIKDLRSTLATYAANSIHGQNLYTLAGELGHDYAVLVKHYAGSLTLRPEQAEAQTVEGLLGIHGIMRDWITERTEGQSAYTVLRKA